MDNINKQHNDIDLLINRLYEVYKNHIEFEHKLLSIRYKIKPDNHINIDNELKKHIKDHINYLNKIKNLQEELKIHIKNYDKFHIHKLYIIIYINVRRII